MQRLLSGGGLSRDPIILSDLAKSCLGTLARRARVDARVLVLQRGVVVGCLLPRLHVSRFAELDAAMNRKTTIQISSQETTSHECKHDETGNEHDGLSIQSLHERIIQVADGLPITSPETNFEGWR